MNSDNGLWLPSITFLDDRLSGMQYWKIPKLFRKFFLGSFAINEVGGPDTIMSSKVFH